MDNDTVTVRVEARLSVITSVDMERSEYERLSKAFALRGRAAREARDEIEGLVDWQWASNDFQLDDVEIELEDDE